MQGQDPTESEESLLEEVEEESARTPIRERYGLVLLLIFVAYVMGGVDESPLMTTINFLLWLALLLATLWSSGLHRRLRRIGIAAIVIVVVSSIALDVISSDEATGWSLLILAVAQLAALLAILSRIMQHETVTLQTVMGGVAAYALIAFVAAAVFRGVDLITDTTFLNGAVDASDYTYFSFVTLTTVGYGDITAATDLAKRLVVVEAFVGQVYIITLVARLVSLWGKPLRAQ